MNDFVLSLALSALSQLGALGGGGFPRVPVPGYGYGPPGIGLSPLAPGPWSPMPGGPVPGAGVPRAPGTLRPYPYRSGPYGPVVPPGYRSPYGNPFGGRMAGPVPLPVVPPIGMPRSGLPNSEAEGFGLAPYR